jgi:hypothetical protein
MTKPNVFISYSHLDEPWKDRFSKHLGIAEKQGLLQTWDDRQLRGGDDWFHEIVNAIESGSVAVLLVSHHSLTSNFILNEEVPRMLARRELQKARFYPVVIEHCDWEAVEWLKPFNLRPRDGRPVGINKDGLRTEEQINQDLAAIAKEIRLLPPLEPVPPRDQECPYRGLEVFEEKHHKLFFGRDNFIEAIWQKLQARQFVAVVGPSGCGKSSVIQAGVFPRLDNEWRKLVFQPGDDPFLNLADKFVEARGKTYRHFSERSKAVEAVAQQIKDNRSIAATVAETLAALPQPSRLLLVADQFEELFTLTPVADRQPFVEALLAAAHLTELKVLVTLRADFMGQAISLTPELSQWLQDGVVFHQPLQRADWEAVILQPAKTVGLHVDPALVVLILEEIEAQPDSLPLLEYALKELWQQRAPSGIGLAQYEAIGRLAGAINQRADAVLAQLPAEQQPLALRALTRLVRVSGGEEEGADTRLRLPLNELTAEQSDVLQSFISERLLVTNRHDRTGEETIEVAHEALIRRWEKLREALDSDREFLVWRRRLDFRRREWEAHQRQDSFLLTGILLEEAKNWLNLRRTELAEPERVFITWEERDEFQIERVLNEVPSLVNLVKNDCLEDWFATLAICKGANLALELTRKVRLENQALALKAIAVALAKAGLISEAIEIGRNVEGPQVKTVALGMISQILNWKRMRQEAFALANEAMAVLLEIKIPEQRLETSKQLIKILLEVGMHSQAIVVISEMGDEEKRSEVIDSSAKNLIEAGHYERLIRLIDLFDRKDLRAETMAFIAWTLASKGIKRDAEQLADEALIIAQSIYDQDERVTTTTYVIDALVETEQFERVSVLVRNLWPSIKAISSEYWQSIAICNSAHTLIELDLGKEAVELARKMDFEEDRAECLASIVIALMDEGEIDAALLIAQNTDRSDDHYALNRMLKAITQILVEDGQIELLHGLLESDAWGNKRSILLREVCERLIEISEIDKAAQLAGDIEETYWKENIFASIAEYQASRGSLADALFIVDQIVDRSGRVRALPQYRTKAGKCNVLRS